MKQIRFLPLPYERFLGEEYAVKIVAVPSTRWRDGWQHTLAESYIYDHEGD